MSNTREVMAKEPTTHSTNTTGISRSRGTSSTLMSGRISTKPNSSLLMSAITSMAMIW